MLPMHNRITIEGSLSNLLGGGIEGDGVLLLVTRCGPGVEDNSRGYNDELL